MSFLSLTDADREEMLAAIGVESVEELFRDIPEGLRFQGRLDLPPALSEPELVAHLEELAGRNAHTGQELSFLGAGIYDHYVPAVVDAVLARGEFLTAYTPYQPEMINDDPYGEGWLVRVRFSDPAEVDELLDVAAYRELLEQ